MPSRAQPPSRPQPPARPRRERRPARTRDRDELRPGQPCLILLDAREGEPDRSGAPATFDGYFDYETSELRRAGTGLARLRVTVPTEPGARPVIERIWGFECWWRLDPTRAGMNDADREELEVSKRLLRGLLRDARRRALVPRP